ncbi:MAG: membrane protein insertion efficiency factor YidD [Deltaproteobacteria bacterium]|nr:membrane protein insertion efficiency factor YidD [Deltaproteobacteria bacterium]
MARQKQISRVARFSLLAASSAIHTLVGTDHCCRFSPSCSHYAAVAISERGLLMGILLSVRRVLRCHPLGASGWDPVPRKAGCA